MVEFIGVLSVDPALAHFEDGGDEEQHLVDPFQTETAAERRVHSPPPSLIPRLHCIVARCLTHSNPLLPSNLTTPIKSTGMYAVQWFIRGLFSKLKLITDNPSIYKRLMLLYYSQEVEAGRSLATRLAHTFILNILIYACCTV